MTLDAREFRLRQDEVAWRFLGDEAVVLDLRTSTYFSGNATTAVLLRRLAKGASEGQLVTAVLEEFETDHASASAGVASFLLALRDRGLLEPPAA